MKKLIVAAFLAGGAVGGTAVPPLLAETTHYLMRGDSMDVDPSLPLSELIEMAKPEGTDTLAQAVLRTYWIKNNGEWEMHYQIAEPTFHGATSGKMPDSAQQVPPPPSEQ